MELPQWIEKYENKTGDKFKRDKRFELFFIPDKGFCEVGRLKNMLVINQLCGDIHYWYDKVTNAARNLEGVEMCGTWCIRKEVRAYIRLTGYEIIKTIKLADGLEQYICRHKRTGKEGRISPAYYDAGTGIRGYFVTWKP